MSKLNTPKVGEVTTEENLLGRKDAFHVPGILVWSEKVIRPGANVKFEVTPNGELTKVSACSKKERQAVADPFVDGNIPVKTLFWVFLLPNTVQNLVHSFEVTGINTTLVVKPIEIEEIEDEDEQDEEEIDDDDNDDGCRGCYGYDDNDEDEEVDNSCRGCY